MRVVLVVVAALLVCASRGGAYGYLASDGHRWAVAGDGPGRALVLDDRDPGYGLTPVALPDRCETQPAVGAGMVVLMCDVDSQWLGEGEVKLMDLTTGEVSATGIRRYESSPNYPLRVVGLGRHWMRVQYYGYHVSGMEAFFRLDGSGKRRVARSAVLPDLDAIELARPLCAPTHRAPAYSYADLEGPPFTDSFFDSGRLVSVRRGALSIWRCNAPRPRYIEACHFYTSCPDVQAGSGILTWRTHAGVKIRDLRTGHQQMLPLPDEGVVVTAVHTAHFLITRAGDQLRRVPIPDLQGPRGSSR